MKQRTVGMAVSALALLLVTFPQFGLADDTTFDTNAPGGQGFFNGTGNVDGHFTVADSGSIAIGLRGADRFVGPITPAGNDYTCTAADANGCNYEFSVASSSLADFTYLLSIQDLTSGKSVSYDPSGADDSYWDGAKTATKDFSKDTIFQNSEDLGFVFLGLNWNPADKVIVSLSASTTTPGLSGTTAEIGFNTAVPEPSAAILGIIFLGAVGR